MKNKNPISTFVKENRKKEKLTQKEFAILAGVSLSFLRDLEQGKTTLKMDNVNKVLKMFNCEVGPIQIKRL